MRTAVLVVHVAAGVLAVLLGPVALAGALRGHRVTRAGLGYHGAVAVLCLTAVGLVPFDWSRLWFFIPVAVVTYLFVLYGDRSARSPRPRWFRGVLRGYGGAWIALWTAILIVSVPDHPWTWVVPALVGSAAIEWLCLRPLRAWTPA
jgi:hypothetical protein